MILVKLGEIWHVNSAELALDSVSIYGSAVSVVISWLASPTGLANKKTDLLRPLGPDQFKRSKGWSDPLIFTSSSVNSDENLRFHKFSKQISE